MGHFYLKLLKCCPHKILPQTHDLYPFLRVIFTPPLNLYLTGPDPTLLTLKPPKLNCYYNTIRIKPGIDTYTYLKKQYKKINGGYMKFYKKILPILMLTLTGSIFAVDIAAIQTPAVNHVINSEKTDLQSTDLNSLLSKLDLKEKEQILKELAKLANKEEKEEEPYFGLISEEDMQTIKPLLTVGFIVASMYTSQCLIAPAFGEMLGGAGQFLGALATLPTLPFRNPSIADIMNNNILTYSGTLKKAGLGLVNIGWNLAKFQVYSSALLYLKRKFATNEKDSQSDEKDSQIGDAFEQFLEQ